MAHMKASDWQRYEDIMNEWQEDAFQEIITWRKSIVRLSTHGEDNNERFEDKELRGLIQYNYFRAWPINTPSDSGELDKESCLLYLNIKYLRDNNYTNSNDQFAFNPTMDRFLIRGVVYKAFGDSHVAQAYNKPLFAYIILKREEVETGKELY